MDLVPRYRAPRTTEEETGDPEDTILLQSKENETERGQAAAAEENDEEDRKLHIQHELCWIPEPSPSSPTELQVAALSSPCLVLQENGENWLRVIFPPSPSPSTSRNRRHSSRNSSKSKEEHNDDDDNNDHEVDDGEDEDEDATQTQTQTETQVLRNRFAKLSPQFSSSTNSTTHLKQYGGNNCDGLLKTQPELEAMEREPTRVAQQAQATASYATNSYYDTASASAGGTIPFPYSLSPTPTQTQQTQTQTQPTQTQMQTQNELETSQPPTPRQREEQEEREWVLLDRNTRSMELVTTGTGVSPPNEEQGIYLCLELLTTTTATTGVSSSVLTVKDLRPPLFCGNADKRAASMAVEDDDQTTTPSSATLIWRDPTTATTTTTAGGTTEAETEEEARAAYYYAGEETVAILVAQDNNKPTRRRRLPRRTLTMLQPDDQLWITQGSSTSTTSSLLPPNTTSTNSQSQSQSPTKKRTMVLQYQQITGTRQQLQARNEHRRYSTRSFVQTKWSRHRPRQDTPRSNIDDNDEDEEEEEYSHSQRSKMTTIPTTKQSVGTTTTARAGKDSMDMLVDDDDEHEEEDTTTTTTKFEYGGTATYYGTKQVKTALPHTTPSKSTADAGRSRLEAGATPAAPPPPASSVTSSVAVDSTVNETQEALRDQRIQTLSILQHVRTPQQHQHLEDEENPTTTTEGTHKSQGRMRETKNHADTVVIADNEKTEEEEEEEEIDQDDVSTVISDIIMKNNTTTTNSKSKETNEGRGEASLLEIVGPSAVDVDGIIQKNQLQLQDDDNEDDDDNNDGPPVSFVTAPTVTHNNIDTNNDGRSGDNDKVVKKKEDASSSNVTTPSSARAGTKGENNIETETQQQVHIDEGDADMSTIHDRGEGGSRSNDESEGGEDWDMTQVDFSSPQEPELGDAVANANSLADDDISATVPTTQPPLFTQPPDDDDNGDDKEVQVLHNTSDKKDGDDKTDAGDDNAPGILGKDSNAGVLELEASSNPVPTGINFNKTAILTTCLDEDNKVAATNKGDTSLSSPISQSIHKSKKSKTNDEDGDDGVDDAATDNGEEEKEEECTARSASQLLLSMSFDNDKDNDEDDQKTDNDLPENNCVEKNLATTGKVDTKQETTHEEGEDVSESDTDSKKEDGTHTSRYEESMSPSLMRATGEPILDTLYVEKDDEDDLDKNSIEEKSEENTARTDITINPSSAETMVVDTQAAVCDNETQQKEDQTNDEKVETKSIDRESDIGKSDNDDAGAEQEKREEIRQKEKPNANGTAFLAAEGLASSSVLSALKSTFADAQQAVCSDIQENSTTNTANNSVKDAIVDDKKDEEEKSEHDAISVAINDNSTTVDDDLKKDNNENVRLSNDDAEEKASTKLKSGTQSISKFDSTSRDKKDATVPNGDKNEESDKYQSQSEIPTPTPTNDDDDEETDVEENDLYCAVSVDNKKQNLETGDRQNLDSKSITGLEEESEESSAVGEDGECKTLIPIANGNDSTVSNNIARKQEKEAMEVVLNKNESESTVKLDKSCDKQIETTRSKTSNHHDDDNEEKEEEDEDFFPVTSAYTDDTNGPLLHDKEVGFKITEQVRSKTLKRKKSFLAEDEDEWTSSQHPNAIKTRPAATKSKQSITRAMDTTTKKALNQEDRADTENSPSSSKKASRKKLKHGDSTTSSTHKKTRGKNPEVTNDNEQVVVRRNNPRKNTAICSTRQNVLKSSIGNEFEFVGTQQNLNDEMVSLRSPSLRSSTTYSKRDSQGSFKRSHSNNTPINDDIDEAMNDEDSISDESSVPPNSAAKRRAFNSKTYSKRNITKNTKAMISNKEKNDAKEAVKDVNSDNNDDNDISHRTKSKQSTEESDEGDKIDEKNGTTGNLITDGNSESQIHRTPSKRTRGGTRSKPTPKSKTNTAKGKPKVSKRIRDKDDTDTPAEEGGTTSKRRRVQRHGLFSADDPKSVFSKANDAYEKVFADAMKSKTINIVTSSLLPKDVKLIESFSNKAINGIRFKVKDVIDKKSTTFCVTPVNKKDEASSRTLKAIQSALFGIPMVDPSWIRTWKKEGKVVLPTRFVRTLPAKVGKVLMTEDAKNGVAKLAAMWNSSDPAELLFHNVNVLFCGSHSTEKKNSLIKLLKEGSATILSKSKDVSVVLKSITGTTDSFRPEDSSSPKRLILLCGETGRLGLPKKVQSELIDVFDSSVTRNCIYVVDSNWVSLSIACAKILPPTNFKSIDRAILDLLG